VERLTESGGTHTWKLFRIGWYINIVLVTFFFLLAASFLINAQFGEKGVEATHNIIMMVTMMIVASLLLLGAGISRYEARLEGQHLEIKLTLKQLDAQIEGLKKEVR